MVDVRKTTPLRRRDTDLELERQNMIEMLKSGESIHDVFAKQSLFKLSDFTDFFARQYSDFNRQIIQDAEIKSMEGSCPPPDLNAFYLTQRGATLKPEEVALFNEAMQMAAQRMARRSGSGAGGRDTGARAGQEGRETARNLFKASTVGGSAGAEDAAATMTEEELYESAQGTLGEWDQFMEDSWGQIFDAQMMQDYEQRMGEVKREVDRLITLAKQGAIGPEFVLIALAKVNVTKNGVLMSWLGKKAFHVNESLSNIANDLGAADPTSVNYYADLTIGKEKTRDGTMQLSLLTQDMQKVTQDVAGVIEQVQSMIGEINRTRREIISRYNVS